VLGLEHDEISDAHILNSLQKERAAASSSSTEKRQALPESSPLELAYECGRNNAFWANSPRPVKDKSG
jgi:hypothetical protein